MLISYVKMLWVSQMALAGGQNPTKQVSARSAPIAIFPLKRSPNGTDGPSASALFAHRLMHYCCEEVEAAMGSTSRQVFGEPDVSDPRYISRHS